MSLITNEGKTLRSCSFESASKMSWTVLASKFLFIDETHWISTSEASINIIPDNQTDSFFACLGAVTLSFDTQLYYDTTDAFCSQLCNHGFIAWWWREGRERKKVSFFILHINGEVVIIGRFLRSFSEDGTSLLFTWFCFSTKKIRFDWLLPVLFDGKNVDGQEKWRRDFYLQEEAKIGSKGKSIATQCRAERENSSRVLSPTGRIIFFLLQKVFERRSHRHSTSDGRCSVGQQMGEDTGRFVFVCRPFALPLTERGNVRVKSTDEDKTIRGYWDPLPRHLHHWIHSNQETRRAGGIFFSSRMNTAKRRLIWIFVHYSKVI